MSLPQVAVGAIILHPDGRVLLVRRGRPPNLGGISLPGGRPHPGETLVDAVVREVREETALRVTIVRELEIVTLTREGYAYEIHEFLCVPEDPLAVPVAGDDAADAFWARPDELQGHRVNDEAIDLVERVLASRS